MGTQLFPPKKGLSPSPIFAPFLLWQNGCLHQDDTCHGDRPEPRRLCVSRGPTPSPKGGQSSARSPICGPFLLWSNGWMHQDSTWYGGRPQPRELCKMGTHHPSTKRGRSPQFSAHACCGKTLGIDYGKTFFTFLQRAAMLALQALY